MNYNNICEKIKKKESLTEKELVFIKKELLNEDNLCFFEYILDNHRQTGWSYVWRLSPRYMKNPKSIIAFKKYIQELLEAKQKQVENPRIYLLGTLKTPIIKNKLLSSEYKVPYLFYFENTYDCLLKIKDEDYEATLKYWLSIEEKTDPSNRYHMITFFQEAVKRKKIDLKLIEVIVNNFLKSNLWLDSKERLIKVLLYESEYIKNFQLETYELILKYINESKNASQQKYSSNKHWKTKDKIIRLEARYFDAKDIMLKQLAERPDIVSQLGSLLI